MNKQDKEEIIQEIRKQTNWVLLYSLINTALIIIAIYYRP